MVIGGLDIGTTGCKVTLFNEQGKELTNAYGKYDSSRDASGHIIDASEILNKVFEILNKVSKEYDKIDGIGVTSFGETFVVTDENGVPLYPSMLYTDPRGKEQCESLCEKLGTKKLLHISGLKPHEMYGIPKMMWLKENKKEVFDKAKYIFQMEDFIVFHLTGKRFIDYSLATRTMGFDIKKLQWSREIFEAADIDVSRLSSPVPSGTVAGNVTKEASEKTGLSEETKIVCVSQDQIAAAVGSGVFSSDVAVDGAGTVECVTPVYDTIPDLDIMAEGNFAVVPYVIPGKYVCYAFSYTGGALIEWFVNTIAKKEKEIAKEKGISVNEMLEKESKSPTDLMVLPHFAGAATPYMDTGSKGVIVGLTLGTKVADIYRACMESVCFEMKINMDCLKKSGVKFNQLNATGGGAKSEEWMQMKADILDMNITSFETVDAGTVGSAMLTGVAVGAFKDLDNAKDVMIHKVKQYTPNKEKHNEYMAIYEKYKKMYSQVRCLV